MYRIILISLVLVSFSWGKVNIVSSTTDLAAIAKEIGGEYVKVESIAKGTQDPHYVEVLPSYMLKVKRAQIYLKVGMELDLWADHIIGGSRNRDLVIVDCSENIEALEVPTGKVDASMGDIHSFGNPHYWLDPQNGILIAETITQALVRQDSKHSEYYMNNMDVFRKSVEKKMAIWKEEFAVLSGTKLLYYHNTWPYFNHRFGLIPREFVEPKPGIMPTPNHVDHLVKLIDEEGIRVLAMEPYFSDTAPNYLAKKTGISVLKMAPSVGGQPGTDTYLEMIEYNLKILLRAGGR